MNKTKIMKVLLSKKAVIIVFGIAGAVFVSAMSGCKASEAVAAKSGAQLWGENCRRCHNSPDPNTFSPEQWITVGMHMQTRALLTDDERDKIVDFLKQ
jgi:cytochrome c2